jgi:hypothetical protein
MHNGEDIGLFPIPIVSRQLIFAIEQVEDSCV